VEEAPVVGPVVGVAGPELLVVSARSAQALGQLAGAVAERLRVDRPRLADVAATLSLGRGEFPYRRAVVAGDVPEAVAALAGGDPGRVVSGVVAGPVSVGFVFAGQGGHRPGVGGELYDRFPVFRGVVDRCAGVLEPVLGADLRPVLFADRDGLLAQTRWAQPALFVLEYALAELWRSWGVVPGVVLGHSLGEWVAACVAGVFSFEDALGLVALRGRLVQDCAVGAMLSVVASRGEVEQVLPDGVVLAVHNGPRECVVSGGRESVERFGELAVGRGWTVQPVSEFGFHSPLVEPAVAELVAAVGRVQRREPELPVVSNVTGGWLTGAQATDPAYWGRQLRGCVEFAAGVGCLSGPVLEVGPGQVLAGTVRRASANRLSVVSSLPHRRDRRSETEAVYRAAGQLWSAGVVLDWTALHDQEPKRYKVSLPPHPYNRKPYWLEKPARPTEQSAGAGDRRPDISDWFYAASWKRAALPGGGSPPHRHWLVFADAIGVGEALAVRLREGGADVTMAINGPAPPASGGLRGFSVDPVEAAGYDRLIGSLPDGPIGIVHCWSITAANDCDEPTARRLGFTSLLRLAQALTRGSGGRDCRIWVLTNGLFRVTGEEDLAPNKATILGPVRVLPREEPGTRLRLLDLDLAGAPNAAQLARLMAELATEPGPDSETVAHRGQYRWLLHYPPQRLPVDREPVWQPKPGGCYLVTGGTGGLGLALAEWLVTAGARVLLTGRTPMPPPEQWEDLLRDPSAEGRVMETVRRVRTLRTAGGEVRYFQADVAHRQQMAAAVQAATQQWGRLNGVFHIAGLAGGGVMQLKDPRQAEEVLRPKVTGTLVLEEVLADQRLDFMVLFGSNAANLGSVGQVDYCAANCFLDAFAQDRGRCQRVITIDWTAWKGVGMAVNTALPSGLAAARHRDVARRGLSVDDGLRALEMVLAYAPEPQIVVSPADLSTLFAAVPTLADSALAARDRESGSAGHRRPEIGTDFVAPANEAERVISEVWQDLLGIDGIGVQDSFFALGGDSLVAIQLVDAINQRLPGRVTLADLYEGSTIAHLAARVVGPEPVAGPEPDPDDRRERRRQWRQQRQRRRQLADQRRREGET
jgi:acyl transferase domain-containing protein/acyl carrier protein